MRFLKILLVGLVFAACSPKEPVVLRRVNILELTTGKEGKPLLKADVIFYNPNASRMKLKGVDIDILVDSVKSAVVSQSLKTVIKPKSEFTVPVEVQLHMEGMGLVDTILGMIGGKKHEVIFTGKLKVSVNGFPLKVPINHKEQIKF